MFIVQSNILVYNILKVKNYSILLNKKTCVDKYILLKAYKVTSWCNVEY